MKKKKSKRRIIRKKPCRMCRNKIDSVDYRDAAFLGKYVSDKIYLRYTRRLSQSSGQEAGVEYRLNRHLLLEGRRDKIGLFHLGLSLNWEY